VAANCWVAPILMLGLAGVMAEELQVTCEVKSKVVASE